VSDDQDEPTQPIRPASGSWQPPVHQPPPAWGRPPQPTQPLPPMPAFPAYPGAARPQPARLAGWVWPLIAGLALLIGVVGGVLGGVFFSGLTSDGSDQPGRSSTGLQGQGTTSVPPLGAGNRSVARVAATMLPSTVQVIAEYDGQAGGATGSGFVLDRQGHVITNNHVVESAASDDGPIEIVDQNGEHHDATIVGRSAVYDLAVLFVKEAKGLPPASLGRSQVLRVGDSVVALGSPLGLSSTVTSGIVSALNRPVTTGENDDSSYINAVQTDAAINPGNSGGPLVNLRGQVVGVNSAIATTGGGGLGGGEAGNIGVGFAIPIEQVQITADQIVRTGEARYPVIGAKVEVGSSDGTGATISQVVSDTPAARSGLAKGDRVTAVDGVRVGDGVSLIVAIRSHRPGETVEFTLVRDGRERTVDITLDSEVG
jgi:putative serine protease PepD